MALIPDWVDISFIRPLSGPVEFRRLNGLAPSAFLALHAGNMGAKQGLEHVVEAARLLSSSEDTLVVLVGDGSEREVLASKGNGVAGLRMLPLQPRELLPDMLSSAGVLLIHHAPMLKSQPSKLLTYRRRAAGGGRGPIAVRRPLRAAETAARVPAERPDLQPCHPRLRGTR